MNKTECTLNSCFVATRAKRHFSQHLAKSSGLIYLAVLSFFANTHNRVGNNLSVVCCHSEIGQTDWSASLAKESAYPLEQKMNGATDFPWS